MGAVFVVQGDITNIQADAVVCSASSQLAAQGFTYTAFEARFPWFAKSFLDLRESLPPIPPRGRRAKLGDAFWLPAPVESDRLKGVVVVAATGGTESTAERAALSVRNALRKARESLRQPQDVPSGRRWLIALPTIGLGMGGYSKDLRVAVDKMVEAAVEEIRSPEIVQGVAIEIDVAFVAFTTLNYRLLADARRKLNAEPPCPLTGPDSQNLLRSIRERRCVLFVGAGLSRGAGLADWTGLLHGLAQRLELDVDKLPRDSHGRLSLDLCLDLAQWFEDKFGREALDECVYGMYGAPDDHSVRPTLAHYFLLSLPFRLCLTTNYDDLLERTLTALRRDPEVVRRPEQVGLTGNTDRACVVKLHGDAKEKTPIVLTRDDFDTFFRNHPVTTALLQGLLLNHTFFFVGYDLRDPNTRQIYSGVAHLVKQASTRAYSLAVRDEDATSRFYEEQWGRQGLLTLRMPGEDRVHASLLFFDWLSRETCDVQSYLHPDLRKHAEASEASEGKDDLQAHLFAVCDRIRERLAKADGKLSPERAKILTAAAELVAALGWKWSAAEWERLADAAGEEAERSRLLRRSLAVAEHVNEIDRLSGRIKGTRTSPA
jgi:O-acetyl-ADP-ribose deacetylase (regulator of RNase III)